MEMGKIMSGGCYDYFSLRIDEFIDRLENDTKQRKSFKKLLQLISEAVHAIEWVDSGDYSPGDENKALDKVFNFLKGDKETRFKADCFDEIKELFNTIENKDTFANTKRSTICSKIRE